MPPGLLHAFEQGVRLERARRYDEALAALLARRRAGSAQHGLRLCVGQLQERIGLYLDALATYWGMERHLASAEALEPAARAPGRRERRRALLSARYRRNVLLGGRVLAKQWVTTPEADENLRDAQRRQLRACLRPAAAEEAGGVRGPERVQAALVDAAEIEPRHFRELRTLFGEYALRDCAGMRKSLRFRDRATLTAKTVQPTELSISLRLDWVRHTRRRDVPVAAEPETTSRRRSAASRGAAGSGTGTSTTTPRARTRCRCTTRASSTSASWPSGPWTGSRRPPRAPTATTSPAAAIGC